jgi:hypothetical protein
MRQPPLKPLDDGAIVTWLVVTWCLLGDDDAALLLLRVVKRTPQRCMHATCAHTRTE